MQLQVTNRSARSARPHRAGSIALVACAAVSIAQLAAPPVAADAGIGIGTDFNGDGMADVAIGVRGDTLGNGVRGGTVVVLYGSVSGLTSFGSQQWSQNTPLVDGQADRADWFGGEVAVGDFDADGFSDLAIAAASEDVGGYEDAGVVHVLYGSPSGLTTTGSQMWTLDTPGVPGVSGAFRQFGRVMAAGDVGRGGYDDLVITDHGELHAGAVTVLYGGANGLSTAGVQRWSQSSRGVAGDPDENDYFGRSLAIGNFGADKNGDVAIGVREDAQPRGGTVVPIAGAVHVLMGSSAGLSANGSQWIDESTPGVAGDPHAFDDFGSALAAGDLGGDGWDELVIGSRDDQVPGPTPGSTVTSGSVHVLSGSATGLIGTGSQMWHRGVPGVEGDVHGDDAFGATLAVGDVDGDGHLDLAIGAPTAIVGDYNAGAVHVLLGSAGGITAVDDQLWTLDSPGIPGEAYHDPSGAMQVFGAAIAMADVDGSGADDLLIGRPGFQPGDPEVAPEDGVVHVLLGTTGGLTATGTQVWNQDSPGIEGDAGWDYFGAALG